MPHFALLTDPGDPLCRDGAAALTAFLGAVRATSAEVVGLPAPWPAADALVLLTAAPLSEAVEERLLERTEPVLLLGPTLSACRGSARLLEAAGVVPGPLAPVHQMRVRPGPGGAAVCARLGGELLLTERWPLADKVADDTQVLLTANWQLRELPVATLRRAGRPVGSCLLGAHPGTLARRDVARLVHRILRALLGEQDGPDVRVGMLGYGAVGAEHAAAIEATEGLSLRAVCDRNPARLQAARGQVGEQLAVVAEPEALLERADLDLVIVSTPPNAHAQWARRVLASGRSVLVEKPFALTVAEVDQVRADADARGLLAASYQNRRFDPDYLAVKAAIHGGALGEVFSYDSFVGGYGHPCNYWHSDAAVSGGALYDWGSHYLDWMLDLFSQPVREVSATAHKLVWFDVTNADHSRVLVRFEGGLEAEFTHSDLAAALKPKWHVLGTRGALRADWREASVTARSLVGTLAEDRLAPADSPAQVSVFTPATGGGIDRTVLAAPAPLVAPLHRELADTLLAGVPGTVTAAQSRRVVALLEAATRSAARGGAFQTPEVD